ncbi:acyl-CoA thioester hydrolase/BAAT C-terminal domain-containing protein [Paramicrobacterium fandaimingii]|uniref:acyl-CoA thioester hydrolase/BAAT C-terminal domain-containing protein n=1 Tax=Paramicrobacterium fandaimingii TaxID=2708079 RepID=UPI001422050D|nr:acyl-CoA thioester hydrolase/BAAT C-terminal domain-containing protein [Microbacterium fandaimingii]
MRCIPLERPEGVRCIPNEHSGAGVLVLAGSSGRIDEDRARVFAQLGCIAESIRWFGGAGQHDEPWEIPLETFAERVENLTRTCDRVYVVGTSFGSEAALLTGARVDAVSGVVAFAPSDVVWAGFDGAGRETSHWTLDGAPLPYVPFDFDAHVPNEVPCFLPLYTASRVTYTHLVESASIPVERIKNLVLVAGGDDQVWPSIAHAERIRDRRQGCPFATTLVSHDAAGHRTLLPGEPPISSGRVMTRGGSEQADRALGNQALGAILDMLTTH